MLSAAGSCGSGLKAKRDSLVQEHVGPFLRGAVATAIEQEQWFGGIGQRDQERMVTVLTVVGEACLLTSALVGTMVPSASKVASLEELGGCWAQTRRRASLMASIKVMTSDSAKRRQKSPVGGGVGDALGSQGVEVDFVVAAQLDVLDAASASEGIERNVQDVVGFMVGKMHLEQMKVVVNLLDQTDLLSQEKDGTDATGARPWTRSASS